MMTACAIAYRATCARTLVSNTMNCNCISILEGTSKLVKRLRQVFLLIKQTIPLFALLLCHFRLYKQQFVFFLTHRVVSEVVCVIYPLFLCFFQRLLLGTVYFRSYCTSVIFCFDISFLKTVLYSNFPNNKKYSANLLRLVMTTLSR